ncbi:acyl-CoA dehydrogenase family protein [Geodermatophilus amargosae]|uniref:acyl-CoA dehydrogenase family protein n=1 Tax=Geodermatophilus amargosae TaxID=1296565 RepID=UPI0034DE0986
MKRDLFDADHEAFRRVVREFVAREVTPDLERWDQQRLNDRDVWLAAAEQGILGLTAPEHLGGGGGDYRFRMVVHEELGRVFASSLASSFSLQDDILIPYVRELGTEQQQQRWLPPMIAGELIMAVAVTEPGTGSDLQGIRTSAAEVDGGWVVNGAKTFITSGIQSDVVVTVCRTDPEGGPRGFTLLVVERGFAGLTSAVLADTVEYTKTRTAIGKPIIDFQNTRFELAEMTTELNVTRSFVDRAIEAYNAGELTDVDAAQATWWASEMQSRIVDRSVQLHGGYGFMLEYPVGRAFRDSRVQKVFGGTNEITKHVIGRSIASGRI